MIIKELKRKEKKEIKKSKTTSKTHFEISVQTLLFYYYLFIKKIKEDLFIFLFQFCFLSLFYI